MGFPSLYLGSTASAEHQGLPDWDITSITDQVEFFGNIARNVGIPTIADIAEGNDPIVLYRATKDFERAGVAGIHIVDATAKLGQTTGLISKQAMVGRIRAAVDARSDLIVTARAQGGPAATKETREQAVERAVAYAQAGADAVWLTGLQFEELPRVADLVKVPLMAQIFVDTPATKAKESRVTVAVYASFMQNIAQSAVYDALSELKSTGMLTKSAKGQRLGSTLPAEFRAKLLQNAELTALGKKYNAS
jgi:methylisocitrate lyase